MTSDYMITSGVLVSMRHMKTNGSLHIVVEVQKEFANEAFNALGGFPSPDTARHVSVAVIKEKIQ